ncbi:GNAT family N-acetyltransferase [Palleronia rufa]|uniref:GNAT family N-acetyltransferase n=1 Tax=Palleronia rufa TaxID=1530186 RepID=UPI00069141CC|nr:N-acetyltransferase [Palleronia rufa]
MSGISIESYRDHDAAATEALLRAAFAGQAEADLVFALRRGGAMAAERVAVMGGRSVGYLALSRMRGPKGWLCLAPVAVQPEWQGRGTGLSLLRDAAQVAGGATVVVLGEPAFYTRAGFSSARAERLASPYPLSHTLILRPGTDRPRETLVYPEAFG